MFWQSRFAKLYGAPMQTLKQAAVYANTLEKRALCYSMALEIARLNGLDESSKKQLTTRVAELFPDLNHREQI